MYIEHDPFEYASKYCMVFPKGLESRYDGVGSVVAEDDYIIYFVPDTPEDIKQRFIKDYAEYHAKEKASGAYR